jgi:ABC-2 type transport system ATP-binding protein
MTLKTLTKDAIQTSGLGKRYGLFWALKDCSIDVPQGSVSALVGPNGAGKTTLLKLLVGLSRPSAGDVIVLGSTPKQSSEYLAETGYLAQEIPLYNRLTAEKHIAMGAHLDLHWDGELAKKRLSELGIPLARPVGKLSGGQRAQVALALALAKKPKLLLLDEPVAALDPLARVEFLTSLTQAVADADGNLTVVMSSHLLADLERVCDHLIILASAETQLCDGIEHVLKTHKLLIGSRRGITANQAYTVIQESHSSNETNVLVRLNEPEFHDPHWRVHDVDIEDIVLAYMKQSKQQPSGPLAAKGGVR